MKSILVLCFLLIAVFSPVSAQPQSRFGDCRPGYIDLTIGGTFFHHVPMQCIAASSVSEPGLYPVTQRVSFEYFGKTFTGSVIGYYWKWKPDDSVQTQYNIAYDGDIGIGFSVHTITIDVDKVHS